MHLNTISNGLGSQSIALLVLAGRGEIGKIDLAITADTGSENDCMRNDGIRTTSKEYFHDVVAPLGRKFGIDVAFVRAKYKTGDDLPPVQSVLEEGVVRNVPMFGSQGGRYRQTCTDKWKIRAIKQEGRRRGAKTMRSAIGLHCDEIRRVKGRKIGNENGFNIFQSGIERKKHGWLPWKWMTHWYPLIDLGYTREMCRELLRSEGIPFLLSTECDCCPHKNGPRWKAMSESKINEIAAIEEKFGGKFFFTDKRIPLKQAIELMPDGDDDFGCQNDVCGV